MKLFAILLLLISAYTSATPTADERVAFINSYDQSVALMYVKEDVNAKDEPDFACSATAFEQTSDGFLFVSASHCVNTLDMSKAQVYLDTGERRYQATIVAFGDQSKGNDDFSVLKVQAPPDAFTVMPLGHSPTQKGERLFGIGAPHGIGKVYSEGTVGLVDIPTPQPYFWQHNVIVNMPGEGPGSSGSTIVCENQMQVCAFMVGHIGNDGVAEPVDRFKSWWAGVEAKTVPAFPVKAEAERHLPAMKPSPDLIDLIMRIFGRF